MVALETRLQQSEQKNAELAAQLEVRERINAALITQTQIKHGVSDVELKKGVKI